MDYRAFLKRNKSEDYRTLISDIVPYITVIIRKKRITFKFVDKGTYPSFCNLYYEETNK